MVERRIVGCVFADAFVFLVLLICGTFVFFFLSKIGWAMLSECWMACLALVLVIASLVGCCGWGGFG